MDLLSYLCTRITTRLGAPAPAPAPVPAPTPTTLNIDYLPYSTAESDEDGNNDKHPLKFSIVAKKEGNRRGYTPHGRDGWSRRRGGNQYYAYKLFYNDKEKTRYAHWMYLRVPDATVTEENGRYTLEYKWKGKRNPYDMGSQVADEMVDGTARLIEEPPGFYTATPPASPPSPPSSSPKAKVGIDIPELEEWVGKTVFLNFQQRGGSETHAPPKGGSHGWLLYKSRKGKEYRVKKKVETLTPSTERDEKGREIDIQIVDEGMQQYIVSNGGIPVTIPATKETPERTGTYEYEFKKPEGFIGSPTIIIKTEVNPDPEKKYEFFCDEGIALEGDACDDEELGSDCDPTLSEEEEEYSLGDDDSFVEKIPDEYLHEHALEIDAIMTGEDEEFTATMQEGLNGKVSAAVRSDYFTTAALFGAEIVRGGETETKLREMEQLDDIIESNIAKYLRTRSLPDGNEKKNGIYAQCVEIHELLERLEFLKKADPNFYQEYLDYRYPKVDRVDDIITGKDDEFNKVLEEAKNNDAIMNDERKTKLEEQIGDMADVLNNHDQDPVVLYEQVRQYGKMEKLLRTRIEEFISMDEDSDSESEDVYWLCLEIDLLNQHASTMWEGSSSQFKQLYEMDADEDKDEGSDSDLLSEIE